MAADSGVVVSTKSPPPPEMRSGVASRSRSAFRGWGGNTWVVRAISFVAFISGWYAYIWAFEIRSFFLPAPHMVLRSLWRGLSVGWGDPTGIWYHFSFTLQEVLIGYSVGAAAGIVLAILMVEIPIFEKVLAPYVIALQSLPKIAVAPLFILWFGFGMTSKVAIVILLVFFPLLINTVEGLKGVSREHLDLMRMLEANRFQVLYRLKIHFAMPYMFAGMKVALALSIVGALVGEFISGRRGLGVMILARQAYTDVAGVFAIFIVLSVMGATGFALLGLAERRVLFWARTDR